MGKFTENVFFRILSSIGLADPDPSAKELPKHRKSTVTSETGFVQFVPGYKDCIFIEKYMFHK